MPETELAVEDATTGPPGVTVSALASYLPGRVPGLLADQPLEVALLAGGRSNLTYLVSQEDRQWVLRRPPLGHVMPKAHDMAREHTILSGLTRMGTPAPQPHHLCEDLAVIGAPFMVMEYVAGTVYSQSADTADLDAPAAAAISDALVDTLVGLHDGDLRGTGLEDLGRPAGYLERQATLWTRQWENTNSRDVEGFAALSQWLTDRAGRFADAPSSLVHGDYRLDNLIMAPSTHEVRAVLDWEMSTIGDPVTDLALLLVYWTQPGDSLRRLVPVALGVTDPAGFPDREALVERYAAARPVDPAHLELCVALVCLKLAVVMESIWFRHKQGQQLGADASTMQDAAPSLVQLGLAVTDGQGLKALSS